jgi:hypothetical protein
MRSIINIRVKPRIPERDHTLELIIHFNVVEDLGAEIKLETQIDMALETLPKMFSQLKVNYNMNTMEMSLTELRMTLRA